MLAITMDFEVAQDEPGTKDLKDEEGKGGLTTGRLLISWLQSPSAVIFGAQKNKV